MPSLLCTHMNCRWQSGLARRVCLGCVAKKALPPPELRGHCDNVPSRLAHWKGSDKENMILLSQTGSGLETTRPGIQLPPAVVQQEEILPS